MSYIKSIIDSIDLNNLLKLFDFQIAIATLLFFVIFRHVFSKLIITFYHKITKSSKSAKESSMYKPLNIFFVLIGVYAMIQILPIGQQAMYILNKIYKLIIIFYICKIIVGCLRPESFFAKKVLMKDPSDKTVNTFLCKIAQFIVWVIYIFICISEFGYDLSGLLTALGLGSAAIALAAQDIVKSILSGVTILTDKPFVIGDWIEVGEYQGTVIDITFRSTRIKSYNNSVITIPNSTVTSTYVVNWNRLTSRRFDLTLNLSLETPVEKVKKIVKEIRVVLENNPLIIKETVQVNFFEIASCSSDIKIFLFVKESDYGKFLKAKQDILCSLLYLCEKENVDLAYPTQTLYVKKKEDIEE